MTVRKVEDLTTYQFAEEFKLAVYAVIANSPSAQRSLKYREQLQDAASGIERVIAEGFGRRNPAEFVQFLRYALASLAESRTCLRDGIHRKYFTPAECEPAFIWARRCRRTLLSLLTSQRRRIPAAHRRSVRPGNHQSGERRGPPSVT
jgi:four helix bundle protein